MIDYRKHITMPIRDMKRGGEVYCLVDIYGLDPSDLATIGGAIGSTPLHRAVERLGLDPNRFQASVWDIPVREAR